VIESVQRDWTATLNERSRVAPNGRQVVWFLRERESCEAIWNEVGMTGWDNFFLRSLGASAALTGLIFVGVSINHTRIMASPYLPNRALEALLALVSVLVL
jgi:hypothetical protein